MGRFTTGDIDYKFMVGVQSSRAADRFGYLGETIFYEDEDTKESFPVEIHYNFDKNKIMVVITIPQKYHSTYYHFRRGHYSKMYNSEEIKQFFDNENRKVTYHKLMKTDTGLELYSSRIANDFDITLSEDKINDYKNHTEYDIPINVNITNEIFNKRKKQE